VENDFLEVQYKARGVSKRENSSIRKHREEGEGHLTPIERQKNRIAYRQNHAHCQKEEGWARSRKGIHPPLLLQGIREMESKAAKKTPPGGTGEASTAG